jgi:N-acyl-L-homoserine lactone synthetase
VEIQRSSYADRVSRLLERVEYRRADSLEDKQSIYRLRHAAYMRSGSVEPRASGMFHDRYDELSNVWLIGVFVDGELAGALRLHVSANPRVTTPVGDSFPDVIDPMLSDGRLVVDATRFAAKLEYSKKLSEIPYVILRPVFIAEAHFRADYITAACLAEHQAFYLRIFSGAAWRSPRPYPDFKRPMALIGYDCAALRQSIYGRYPFYRSTEAEQMRLFARSSNGAYNVSEAIGREAESELAR